MKILKKIICFSIVVAMLLAIASCGGEKKDETAINVQTETSNTDDVKQVIDEQLQGDWVSVNSVDGTTDKVLATFKFDKGSYTGTVKIYGDNNQSEVQTGTYEITTNEIVLNNDNGNKGKLEYKFDNDSLSISSGEMVFQKGTEKDVVDDENEPIWEIKYYTDEFNEPTSDAYIINHNGFTGTFNNSATTNSKLASFITVDKEKVSIFLLEYEKNYVKNNSASFDDEYIIKIKEDDGTTKDITGYIYAGTDRIIMMDNDRDTIVDALSKNNTVSFYIQNVDTPTSEYSFKVDSAEFTKIYGDMQ